MGNVLISGSRAIWMDLESVCFGPFEWDVVNLPAATWPQFGALDPALMRLFANVRSLCVAVWCWAEFERSKATQEAAIHHLGQLKDRFSCISPRAKRGGRFSSKQTFGLTNLLSYRAPFMIQARGVSDRASADADKGYARLSRWDAWLWIRRV
jgi:hypothetical protein